MFALRHLGPLACLALVAALGCTATENETCELTSDQLSVVAEVVDSGWDIRASIDFESGDRQGTNSPVRLCATDILTINGQTPIETTKASSIEYHLDWEADGERSVQFSIERQSLGEVIDLAVELPPTFEIVSPMDDDPLDRTNGQALEWEPANPDGTMQIRLHEELGGGQCIIDSDEQTYEEAGGVGVPDTGTWTIDASDLGSMTPLACNVTIGLTRVNLGDYPTTLGGGGRIEARTEREVDVADTE
ncbi:MAG: hypothetical protein AAF799_25100 [Myxococcota bacterium]